MNSETAMKAEMVAIKRDMEGIISLLLSLAAIAECACHAPFPLRARLLSLLRQADCAAQDFVYYETGLPVHLPAHDDDASVEVEALAARFRILAIALAGVVFRLFAGADALCFARDAEGVSSARGPACRSLPPFDTS